MTQSFNKGELRTKIANKICQENNEQPPIEFGFLPPQDIKLDLYHAVEEKKLAEIEYITKKIKEPSTNRGVTWDWGQLKQKKDDLQQLFHNSNKDIKENKASTARFREIIREKLLDKRNVKTEIENVEADIAHYKETYDRMKQYVNEYSVYEAFLESVTQNAPEFNSVGDILNRYETLEHTRNECSRLLEEELEGASEMRKAMVTLVDEKSSQLKTLSNRLVMLQVNKKQAKVRRMYWEHMLQRMKNAISSREEERLALSGACWDLYRELCARRHMTPTAARDNLDEQLDFIRKTIIFYKEVATIASAKHAQNSG